MRKWLLVALFSTICITVTADARVLRPAAGRSMAREGEDSAPATPAPSPVTRVPSLQHAPIPQQPATTAQPDPPSQPPEETTPQVSGAPGAQKIYFWKQGGVLHVVSDLNDVPQRYAKQVQSADEKPTLIRAIAEGKKQGASKPLKKAKRRKPRNLAPAAP
ncbi:MAG: hypothetical protein CXR31_10445 [Geobacter sp.]|nr:MAG: hypothetical protein CXR31_10445 [Geobacter sp.]